MANSDLDSLADWTTKWYTNVIIDAFLTKHDNKSYIKENNMETKGRSFRIPEEIFNVIVDIAADEGKTFTGVLLELLEEGLDMREVCKKESVVRDDDE